MNPFRCVAAAVAALCLVVVGAALCAANPLIWKNHVGGIATESSPIQGGDSQAGLRKRGGCGGNDGQLWWCGEEA
ncbi:MAG TPA: hypothetical protein VGM84_10010 [Steroidobacteraceae bacterium]|jgi:hypothetical protein